MGLWDTAKDILSGGGSSDINRGYEDAQYRMYPYQKGGAEDYQNYRNYVTGEGDSLKPWNGAGTWQYNQINQSPVDYYNTIMKGYNESPQAKYEQEQAMRAANAGGSASGMLGSGAFFKSIQQNAADISARDQQRYFGNVQNTNQMQMGYLEDLRNRQRNYNAMQQYLTSLGYGAASGMGEMDIARAKEQARIGRETVGDIASLAGYGGGSGMFSPSTGGGLSGTGGFNQGLPPYMQNAIYAGA